MKVNKRPTVKELQLIRKISGQQGAGLSDVIKKTMKILGPLAKKHGPTILKEIVIPTFEEAKKVIEMSGKRKRKRKRMKKGKGLSLAGKGLGLAGSGRKISRWNMHVQQVSRANPGLGFKELMPLAKSTYQK